MNALKLNIFLIICTFFSFNQNIFSQSDDDSVRSENYWKVYNQFLSENYMINEKPFIELDMGFSNPFYHENVFKEKFAKIGMLDLKLGFEHLKTLSGHGLVQKSKSNYFFLQNYNNNLPFSEQKYDELNLEAWRAGLSFRKAYIYDLGSGTKLQLYNTDGFGWTLLRFPVNAKTTLDQASIDLFGKDLRFGNQTEGGLKFSITDNIGINAGFERALVYPRFMFWYWAGGEIVYYSGEECINMFVKSIEKSSPEFAPIVYFLLQNAWSYGYYELRKDRMNWPFETVPPFMFETFKLGLSFRF